MGRSELGDGNREEM
jgi:hypothetical protein